MHHGKRTFCRRLAASFVMMLVLAAFVLSSLIPAGFMPEFAEEGGSYEIVICSGMGMKTVTVQGEAPDNSHEKEKPAVCDYKTFAAAQSVEPAAPAYLPAPVIELGMALFAQEQILSQTLFTPLSARGPPTV